MCQFAKAYPLRALQSFIETDASLSVPTIQSVTNEVLKLNDKQFTQELTAQIQSADCQSLEFTQEAPAQIQDVQDGNQGNRRSFLDLSYSQNKLDKPNDYT